MPCIQKWAGDVLGCVCDTVEVEAQCGPCTEDTGSECPFVDLPAPGTWPSGGSVCQASLAAGSRGRTLALWRAELGLRSTACPPALGLPWGERGTQHVAGRVVWRRGTPRSRSRVTFHFQYRSINHRMDAGSMWLYRWYYSDTCQW